MAFESLATAFTVRFLLHGVGEHKGIQCLGRGTSSEMVPSFFCAFRWLFKDVPISFNTEIRN
jgi:hypothetical protein